MSNFEIDIVGEIFDAIFKAGGKWGIYLNAHGKRICFIVWGITEVYWSYIHFQRSLYSQSFFAVIGVIMYAYGYYKWRENEKED